MRILIDYSSQEKLHFKSAFFYMTQAADLLYVISNATSPPGVPFVMSWKSGPLARSNDIPVLNGFVNTID